MKESILDDVIKIVFPDNRLTSRMKNKIGVANIDETQVGNFLCIYDERNEIMKKRTQKVESKQR